MNVVHLSGYLGKEVESKFIPSGKQVATFDIGVNDGYGENKTTTWVRVIAWEKTAELAEQYLHKGSKVLVTGRLVIRSYEKDGQTKYITEVIANQIEFLDKKPEDSKPAPKKKAAPAEIDDSDIPF